MDAYKVNQLKAGALLNYVILGLNAIVGLAYTPYMLRMMGQNEYGLYSMAASIIAYLTLLDLGFGNAIIRYTAKFRSEGKAEEQYSMFGMFIILYSVIAVFTLGVGVGLYFNTESIFGNTLSAYEIERAEIIILLLTLNLSVTFPLSVFGAIITAYEDFVFLRSLKIGQILLNTLVMIALLSFGYKALAMVIVQTVFNILSLLLNFVYCRAKIGIRFKFNSFKWEFLREISIYSFWIFLGVILDRIYWSTGQFVLGATVGTVAVSVFAVAILLQQLYMSFSTAISSVFLPRITAMVASNTSEQEISNLFIRTGRIQYIVLAFLLSGFVVFGQPFIDMWAGEGYSNVYYITLIFWIPLTFPLIQNLGITILQARNQMRFRSLVYIVIAIFCLALQIPFSKFYGEIGCAIAVALGLVIGQIIVMNFYYHNKQKINIILFWKEIAKMSIIPVGLCVVMWSVVQYINFQTPLRLCFGVVFFSLVYIPLFWKFGTNGYERNLALSIIGQMRKRVLKR